MIIIYLSNILLAVTVSIDALGIGIAYSLKGVKIPFVAKGIIFLISFVLAYISIITGNHFTNFFPPIFAKTLGVVILLAIGIYTVLSDPFTYDVDKSEKIDPKEALLMGFALSIDSIGVGISSAVAGFSSSILPIAISTCQFIFLYLGEGIGVHISKRNRIKSRFWTIISGGIIVLIAILRAC